MQDQICLSGRRGRLDRALLHTNWAENWPVDRGVMDSAVGPDVQEQHEYPVSSDAKPRALREKVGTGFSQKRCDNKELERAICVRFNAARYSR